MNDCSQLWIYIIYIELIRFYKFCPGIAANQIINAFIVFSYKDDATDIPKYKEASKELIRPERNTLEVCIQSDSPVTRNVLARHFKYCLNLWP